MPLTTPFTDTEFELAREIIGYKTLDMEDLKSRMNSLNDAGAEATRDDIAAWKRIRYGTVNVLGGLKGTDFNTDRDRAHITNRVRLRLNLSALPGTLGRNDFGVVRLSVGSWFDAETCDD